jgi:hypothetical protein
LDYTFHSHRTQISKEKFKTSSNDYIYDLTNTWEINMAFIENTLTDDPKMKDLVKNLQSIKSKFEQKKHLKEKVSEIKGKSLIEKQIYEEIKKMIEENDEYYNDQIKELTENLDNKEEYIKIFEKKLKEVEIYVQKNTKNLTNSEFEKHKDFKMNDFIEVNTKLSEKREKLNKDVLWIREELSLVKDENYKFRNTQTNANEELNIKNNTIEIEKLKSLMKKYQNQIMFFENKNKFLKNLYSRFFNNFISLEAFKIGKVSIKKPPERTISNNRSFINNDNKSFLDVDKSCINNNENLRKAATFMDFSIILNNKKSSDETNLGGELNDITGNFNDRINQWDISCINKD